MTSGTVRIYPLSDQQERRLLDYLDAKYLEIHQEYRRRSASRGITCTLSPWLMIVPRHEPQSKLPTLRDYLMATQSLFTLTLQIPPVAPSGMMRTSLLLRLTGTVTEDVLGYSPDSTDLTPLLEWLDMLDRGWLCVLCGRAWDPARVVVSRYLKSYLKMRRFPPRRTARECVAC
jgi:hypothetical protein